ncbi:MAG: DUF4178 domain-containing protein [Vulcanimicrobiota bacterium]
METTKCPSCGAVIDVKDPSRSKSFFCSFCDTAIDLGTGETQKLTSEFGKPRLPLSALRLGSEGNINGTMYQVIGRIRYKDSFDSSWWDEWLLLSSSGQYLWLSEDDGTFVLMQKYTPKVPIDPCSVTANFEIDGYRLEVEDKSNATIEFFEGELTWKAKVGETIGYIDAWKGQVFFSCEYTDREINYFQGKEIPTEIIYKSFKLGKPPEPEDEIPRTGLQLFADKVIKGPAFYQAIIFGILMAMAAFFLGTMGARATMPTPEVNAGAVVINPLRLESENRIYKLDTKVKGLNNSSVILTYELLNAENQSIMEIQKEYWEEHGRDWQASDTEGELMFTVEQSGDYTLKVGYDSPKTPNIVLDLRKKVYDTRPMWALSLLLLAYPFSIIFFWLITYSLVPNPEPRYY